jgi:ferrochelatase
MTELVRQIRRQAKGRAPRVKTIRSWPAHPGYVEATCGTVRRELANFARPPHVLFNAHGLPMKVVNKGDPYPSEIRDTVEACVRSLGLPADRWSLSFQSRVGYLEWLRPYTEEEIPRLAKAGVKDLLVVPLAFVCDHFETLYEMRILQAGIAKEAGIERYAVAPALNDDATFLAALADLARSGFASGETVAV